ncbi:class I SAM-dependent methyltransferase [Marinicrinis sediminis]|uniref:Class I SAM-dependent methyltransferase n=1 Tax=Marinicrinis sediminis TaxID=1652465 RepID=A0ABW5RE97_9BACL
MTQEAWTQFFGRDYVAFSEMILSPERTQFERNAIVEMLKLPAGASILDLGCGQGRLSIPLAQSGYRVTGFDGAPHLLAEAKRRAEAAHVQVNWVQGDMRELVFSNEFDAVINIGTAFGYVPSQEEDQRILERIYRALKKGGRFVQDTENRDFKLTHLGQTWSRMQDQIVCSHRAFHPETGRWQENLFWFTEEGKKETLLDLRLYSATELIQMTEQAGLKVRNVYGGFDLQPLAVHSPRMLLLSDKGERSV